MKAKPIDVELVRSLLEYRPEVGGSCLVWKVNVNQAVKAGTHAGSLSASHGYWCVGIKNKLYLAHRIVWVLVHGEDPQCQIDHINGKEAGNQIENLRLASNNQYDNTQNAKTRKDNSTGYTGVTRDKYKYRGRITHNGKQIYLGYFDTPEEAHEAYVKAKKELHSFQPEQRA